jgi:two-component system, cell cycle sensor histidine kinase and response regulator CckA
LFTFALDGTVETPASQVQIEKVFSEKPELHAQLVRQLYDLLPIGLSATVVNAAILVLFHWKATPHSLLLIWFSTMISIVVLQYFLLVAYRRNSSISDSPSRWGVLFIAAGALNGLGWGSATLFLFPQDSLAHQVFLAFLQGGMMAGAAGAFSALLTAYLAFSAPAFLPIILKFFLIGDEMHLAMGTLLVIFATCMTVCAHRVNLATVSSFRKGLENLDLISNLTESNDRLERTNTQLEHEISERGKAEEALRKSESTYRAIFEHTGAATIIIEEDETVSMVNSQCEKFSGYSRSEVEGRMKLREFIADAEDAPRLLEYHRQRRLDAGKAPVRYEFRFKDKSGTVKDTLVTVGMIAGTKRSVASLVDISDKKKIEEEYLKVEKLESLGILAGGIAHDFNNILTAILGNISLAKIFAQDKVRSRLEEAEKASAKARDLTQQLLSFARAGAPVKKTLSLPELIRESTAFALSGSNVRCEFSIPDGLWLVDVDEGQISRVITNLVINADQAMPQGGTIQVSAENTAFWAPEHPGLPLRPGKYVKIAVRDEGAGIPREHLSKIFDPYFSTKVKGTGLGLATAFSIINKHGGYITVDSEQGNGSIFHFYLPTSKQQVAEISDMKKRTLSGKGRVLVMEDGDEVRRVLGEMLEHLGYYVDSVRNGAEVLQAYRQSRELGRRYDLVIMDLTIPGGMGGRETIKQLLELDPKARAIVSSGYSNDPVMADFADYGFTGFISKPYKIEELSDLLKKTIGGQKGRMLQYRAS